MNNSWLKVLKATLLCRDASFKQFTPSVTQYLNDDDRFLMLKSNKKNKGRFSKVEQKDDGTKR